MPRRHKKVKSEAHIEAAEKMMPRSRMRSTAKKITRVRKAAEDNAAPSGDFVVTGLESRLNSVFFKAGKLLGKAGSYLEGK